jgi:hypothetical protein
VKTKRPDDYFAEMAKSDQHMQKVSTFLHHIYLLLINSNSVFERK